MMKSKLRWTLLTLVLTVPAAYGEPAWVSDEFEIMLRSGPSTSNAIQLMLGSGLQLEVLERDPESGYSRVSTMAGTEGWVLTRYLMAERSAREQLETLTSELTDANSRGTSMGSQLTAIKDEYDAANSRIDTLQREKAVAENELAEIRRTAAIQHKFGPILSSRRIVAWPASRHAIGLCPADCCCLLALFLASGCREFVGNAGRDTIASDKRQTFSPARNIHVSTTVSGLRDILSMP